MSENWSSSNTAREPKIYSLLVYGLAVSAVNNFGGMDLVLLIILETQLPIAGANRFILLLRCAVNLPDNLY